VFTCNAGSVCTKPGSACVTASTISCASPCTSFYQICDAKTLTCKPWNPPMPPINCKEKCRDDKVCDKTKGECGPPKDCKLNGCTVDGQLCLNGVCVDSAQPPSMCMPTSCQPPFWCMNNDCWNVTCSPACHMRALFSTADL
jgi:hypothetical protein